MDAAGMGRHIRLCVILVKVGTAVARAVFEKRVKDLTPTNHIPSPWTVDEFLLASKPKIKPLKLHSHMWSKVFPVQSRTVELQQWDLALFCTILIACCDLRPDIKLDISMLRNLRNKLYHMSKPSIDDQKYQDYLNKLRVSFDRCLKEINDDAFTTEMNKMFEYLEQGHFSQVDAEEMMKKLQFMEEKTNERLDELGQYQRSANGKLDDLLQKVELLITSSGSANKLKVPESGAKIEVRNCSLEKDNEISELMVKCFEECNDDDDDGEVSECLTTSHAKCKKAVYKMHTKLLSKGYTIIGAHKGCVFLQIKCSTMASLMSYFHDYVSGQLALELKVVEDAIRTFDGCEDIALEIVINTEELLETVNGIVTTVSELMKTEGIHTQITEGEIQSKGKYVETDYAEPVTTVSELMKAERILTKTEEDIQSKGNLQRDSVSMPPPLEVEYIQQNRESVIYRRIGCAEQRVQDDTAVFKTSLERTNFIGKYALFLGIIMVITALCSMCFTTVIRVWVHPDTAPENQKKEIFSHTLTHMYTNNSRTPDTKMNTKGQNKQIQEHSGVLPWNGNYLGLLHLQLADHSDQTKEKVLMVAQTVYSKESEMMKKFKVTAAHIVDTMIPKILDAVELQSAAGINITGQIIKNAEEMKTETEATQQRYMEIQTEVQKIVASRNKEVVSENKTTRVEMEGEKRLAKAGKLAQKELDEEKLKMEEEVTVLKSKRDKWMEQAANLGNADIQFIEFWSEVAAALYALRTESRSWSVYLYHIENPKHAERLKVSIGLFKKRWEGFGRVCSDYVQKSGTEIYTLYNSLSALTDTDNEFAL